MHNLKEENNTNAQRRAVDKLQIKITWGFLNVHRHRTAHGRFCILPPSKHGRCDWDSIVLSSRSSSDVNHNAELVKKLEHKDVHNKGVITP